MRKAGAVVHKDDAFYASAERRIEFLTVGMGASAALVAGFLWGVKAGASIALGAALSWLNYRWMKQGVGALIPLATAQAGAEKVKIPKSVYFKFLGRYALLLVAAYVILSRLRLPATFLIAGLFAVVAAVMLELLFELFGGRDSERTDES
jgi:predicted membrane-bound spermidine synthase